MIRSRPRSARTAHIARAIATVGYSVQTDALPADLLDGLTTEARALWREDEFRPARIGSGDEQRLDPGVRSDRILWLDETTATPAQAALHAVLEELRLQINHTTFIGLFDWEGHYACYPPGARYRRHLDTFAHSRERQVSTILYLNRDWQLGDGGELRLWTQPAGPDWTPDAPSIVVEPRAGTLVTFLAEDFYHEVLPARVERFSLTGWFRVRSL